MSGGGISGQSDAQDAQGTILTTLIGNRKPDEIIAMVKSYYQKKGLIPSVQNQQVGIVAAIGSNLDIAGTYLECSDLTQTQNIQEHYRIVTQVWGSEEGSNISVQVNGYADLVASDGNEKIKPTDCTSTNEFENGLLESLKK